MEDSEERIVTPLNIGEDTENEYSLRPKKISEYIGQKKIKEKLEIFIEAAKRRKESLDHVLLYGPPGLGKTTLANIIAIQMGGNLKVTSGPAIERAGDLAAILTSLNNYDVLFTSENKAEINRQLRIAFASAKRYAGENCKNEEIPKYEDLIESKSDLYTIFIRY